MHEPAALRINGITIADDTILNECTHHADAPDPLVSARQTLAIRELLRQRAQALHLIDTERASAQELDDNALDALLAAELQTPAPTRDDCLHYYRHHAARFRRNDIVHASHILFAVTAQTPLALIRAKAEETLQQLRATPEAFETTARELSNCPSGGVGGSLGQLLRGDSVAEFEHAVFDVQDNGILPHLVNTRFGFHIVRVDRRIAGDAIPFDEVADDIARFLAERVRHKAMQQYVTVLASQAQLEGVDLGAANGPLVQ
ncbi:peptidylprolyl isomerase [Oxalicibacterium solurbis]|uniref:peptidylprolyl isomerase n=1 Tax=Oxalicibacterium solurbis TaxID=69280 RepID=A0A8J3B4J9_9BURK|nr:peptidylprolyl isomerase [Oxalicibacterium solurbis]GGI54915.1 peptidyl-prolyl cis-trans isomerase [Oxalicibacterium solurbis]